jgi:hypothetical protein
MPILEDTLETYLRAASAVAALVSGRIYPQVLPSRKDGPLLPALTYTRISGPADKTLAGANGRVVARVQLDCWAERYAEAKALAAAVKAAMDALEGTAIPDDDSPPAFVKIGAVTRDNEQDVYEPDTLPRIRRVILDYLVAHQET